MDFGFINAILRSSYMPPSDMWLSGYTINYYYFGHFIAAVLTRLSQIPPEVVYNLMIAVIFAFCFTASFSIGINLFYHFLKNKFQRPLAFRFSLLACGLLTAYLVTNAANLQPIYHLLTKGSSTYWYPDATRFIVKKFGAADETIHEFPQYSFVVADLHGHVSDIPTALMLIAFSFVLFIKITENPPLKTNQSEAFSLKIKHSLSPFSIFHPLLLGFLLSTSYMTNAMDGPVYFALAGLSVFGGHLYTQKYKNIKVIILKTVVFFIFTSLSFVIFSYPFLKNFNNFTGAITPVDFHSPLWMLMVLWGFQLFMGLSFLIFLFFGTLVKRENLAKIVAGFFGIKVKVIDGTKKDPDSFNTGPGTIDFFILFLLIISIGLIIFPEVFYIKDIYIHEYQRANTMFKMTYQAFIMLYISVSYILFRILFHIKNSGKFLFPQVMFLLISLAGIISVSIYPYYAIRSYYGLVNYQGLDGLKYLQSLYPDDYKLIKLLNSDASPLRIPHQSGEGEGEPVLLEAIGDSYTKYGRISANTGISTVLGWPVHEWLWRNGYDIPGKRTADVQKIYESTDSTATKKILKEYKVDYVWISQLEREKYPNLNEFKFRKIGKPILKINNSILYQINR